MVNNNKENRELVNNKEHEKKCEFVGISFSTGDQFRKVATLRSKDGPVTEEQVRKFHEESEKEANEWWKNHPGEPVTIRVLENEAGEQKQIVEVFHKKDLIALGDFRARIYDINTGEQIVGEENIRKEIERRQELWDQWKKEGKLEKVDHEIHHTNDGSIVQVYTMVPPADAEKLHPNEINDETKWAPIIGGKLKIENSGENKPERSQRVDENRTSEESSKGESKISEVSSEEENVEDKSIVEKIKKDINEWSVKKLDFTLSSGGKGSKDCLVHSSAKVNISELGTLIYPVEIFTDSERKELSEVLNNSNSLFDNFISSRKVRQESLNKDNYQIISLANGSISDAQPTDKEKSPLIIFGVIFVLLVAGLAIVKTRFSKNNKKAKVK